MSNFRQMSQCKLILGKYRDNGQSCTKKNIKKDAPELEIDDTVRILNNALTQKEKVWFYEGNQLEAERKTL